MQLINLQTDCDFWELTPENPITGFDCGDIDLNDFFNSDALLFQQEKLYLVKKRYRHIQRFLLGD